MEYEQVLFPDGSVASALDVALCLVQLRRWAADLTTAGVVFEAFHDVLVGMEPADAPLHPYQQMLIAAGYLQVAPNGEVVYDPVLVQVLHTLQQQGDVYHRLRQLLFVGVPGDGCITLQLVDVGGRDG
jgi:hypothetical protein